MAGMVRSPAWLLALAVLCGGGPEARGHCGEQERCRDLGSTDSILECIQLCKFDITGESPVYPGYGNLQPPGEADHTYGKTPFLAELPAASLAGQQVEGGALSVLLETLSSVEEEEPEPGHDDKRSYPMEHFRWGKPVGRKRRPVKVYSNGIEEDLSEAYPTEMRRELPDEPDYVLGEGQPSLGEKRDGSYKMNHFRWGGPPASKRYGGFMKSWGGHSQKPLLTLFKNVIIKDGHQKKDQ